MTPDAVERALESGLPTKMHVVNMKHRLRDGKVETPPPVTAPQALQLSLKFQANLLRYDALRGSERPLSCVTIRLQKIIWKASLRATVRIRICVSCTPPPIRPRTRQYPHWEPGSRRRQSSTAPATHRAHADGGGYSGKRFRRRSVTTLAACTGSYMTLRLSNASMSRQNPVVSARHLLRCAKNSLRGTSVDSSCM